MFSLFNKKKKQKEDQQKQVQLNENTKVLYNEEGGVSLVREGEATAEGNRGLMKVFSEQNNIPIFKGQVKHAYESDFLEYKDKCPKCNAPTEQMMSNFAYATQEHSRLLAAPGGHFCTECPTVIIDDDIMRQSIDRSRFEYMGVFNVETGYEEETSVFQTLNGEKPLYILDEFQEGVLGIMQSVHQKGSIDDYQLMRGGMANRLGSGGRKTTKAGQGKSNAKRKKKKKAARKARKRRK